MDLTSQRRIAASLLDCGLDRVWFDPKHLHDIKEAITKSDMRLLISDGIVKAAPIKATSRVRARKTRVQKRKGLRRGAGSKKGTANANAPKKEQWMNKVRSQREFLRELRDKKLVTLSNFRQLYLKVKGGLFRSKRHIKIFIDDHRLWNK